MAAVRPAANGTVLLVVKSPGNQKVIGQFLQQRGLQGVAAIDEESLAMLVAEQESIRMALVDVAGLESKVWRLCQLLQMNQIPFIVLSSPQTLSESSNALALGAKSILQKPVAKAALVQLIDSLMLLPADHQGGSRHDQSYSPPN